MKKFLTKILFLFSFITPALLHAQNRPDRLYSVSGFGLSVPVGESTDYLKPKFSTAIGLNIGLGKGGMFLYPKLSLHAYRFDELQPDAGYNYSLQKGRATTYLLNLGLGYRKITGKFAQYAFLGGGGGFILTPRILVNNTNLQANLDNKSNSMGIVEGGIGIEYNLRMGNLFLEGSYMRGFSKIQDRAFQAVPLTIGIKPNLSKLLKR